DSAITALENAVATDLVAFDINSLALVELGGRRTLVVGECHSGGAIFASPEFHDGMPRRILVDPGDTAVDPDQAGSDPRMCGHRIGFVVPVELLGSSPIYGPLHGRGLRGNAGRGGVGL